MIAETVESIYELLPLQQGMIFNSLYRSGSGVDIVQVVSCLHEAIEVDSFQRACRRVVERHPILRTAVWWENQAEPMQVVFRHVNLPLEQQDWSSLTDEERQAKLSSYLETDRHQEFRLTEAPFIRLGLFRAGPEQFYFIFTFHHAILDGRSLHVLLKEIFTFYEAFRQGQNPDLPLPPPYQTYVAWVRQKNVDTSQSFWQHLLAGFTEPTPLIDGNHQHSESRAIFHTAYHQVSIAQETTAALEQWAQAHDLTLNTLIQAAWALLLSRYSGQDDVVFGATRSCRRRTVAGVDGMVGLFINTLPVRVLVTPETLLLTWLQSLRAQNVAVRDHQHTPLALVQRWSEVPAGVPLFNTIVVYENQMIQETLQAQGGAWTNRFFDLVRQPNYPLALGVFAGSQLRLRLIYDRDRFDPAFITRVGEHLQAVLEVILANPMQRLGELTILTDQERRQMLVEWNATHAEYRSDCCVHQLVEEQVRRTPAALAVADSTQRLNYSELNLRANQLAQYLQQHGVSADGPAETRVGVCLERSVDLIVALLGVLKAGGAYVALDPSYPLERLAFMIDDAQVTLLLTQRHVLARLPFRAPHILCVDDSKILSSFSTEPPEISSTPHHLAYVIYTSGSTGQPKGVAVQHRGLMNLVAWHQRIYQVSEADRATQIAGPGFDASVWEIWPYLASGASIHVPSDRDKSDPQQLSGWLALHAITICFLPTALAETILDQGWPSTPQLRALLVGGDQLHPVGSRFPFELVNHYGPTENTVVTTRVPVSTLAESTTLPPIGRPIANTQVYVLDSWLQPMPVGVAGELYIGGDGLARGYLDRPALTAATFVPNPFVEVGSSKVGTRLYRTGDIVRYRDDGNLEFLGRIDDQVKIRGFRIELGEIEAALRRHPDLTDAVVIVRQDDISGKAHEKRLVAYVVPQTGLQPISGSLRTFLRDQLPEYMVPSAFISLDTLPLTPNGKIDRKQLPSPAVAQLTPATPYVPPRTPLEETLAEIWTQSLRLSVPNDRPKLSIYDNIFDLGGNSLSVLQISLRVRDVFQVDLPLHYLFNAPTIAQFAEVIERAKEHSAITPSSIVRLDRNRYRT